jgi:hypothetical protein
VTDRFHLLVRPLFPEDVHNPEREGVAMTKFILAFALLCRGKAPGKMVYRKREPWLRHKERHKSGLWEAA